MQILLIIFLVLEAVFRETRLSFHPMDLVTLYNLFYSTYALQINKISISKLKVHVG